MDTVAQLRQLLREEIARKVPIQTVWAEASNINMSEGTMFAVSEDLEYFDVLLGLGGDMVEPVEGTKVLLGLVGNNRNACFLIYAEQVNRRFISGDNHGGLVLANAVVTELNTLKQDINSLKAVLAGFVPVPGDGGAALKVAAATWSAAQLQPTVAATVQSKTVSHGGA